MIRLKLAEFLKSRGKTAYWLHRNSTLLESTVYSLVRDEVKRIDFKTINEICKVLKCQPGDLLVFEEDSAESDIE